MAQTLRYILREVRDPLGPLCSVLAEVEEQVRLFSLRRPCPPLLGAFACCAKPNKASPKRASHLCHVMSCRGGPGAHKVVETLSPSDVLNQLLFHILYATGDAALSSVRGLANPRLRLSPLEATASLSPRIFTSCLPDRSFISIHA